MLNRKYFFILGWAVLLVLGLVIAKQVQAIFTVEKVIKNNVIRTGNLSLVITPDEGLLKTTALLPGQTVSGQLNITNNGTVPATVSLSAKKSAGYKDVYEALVIKVIDENGHEQFSGSLNDLQNIPLSQTALTVGQASSWRVEATLPLSAGGEVNNLYANISFTVSGQQAG